MSDQSIHEKTQKHISTEGRARRPLQSLIDSYGYEVLVWGNSPHDPPFKVGIWSMEGQLRWVWVSGNSKRDAMYEMEAMP